MAVPTAPKCLSIPLLGGMSEMQKGVPTRRAPRAGATLAAAGAAAQDAHAGAGVDSAGGCGSHGDARFGAGAAAAEAGAAPKEKGSGGGRSDAAGVALAGGRGRGTVPSESIGGGGMGLALPAGLGRRSRGEEACSIQQHVRPHQTLTGIRFFQSCNLMTPHSSNIYDCTAGTHHWWRVPLHRHRWVQHGRMGSSQQSQHAVLR